MNNSPWQFLYGFEPVSLCDWPNHIASVFFFGGCNLRCPTCHNWQIAMHHHELTPFPYAKALSFLAKRKLWLDGIVITGGEPTTISGITDILLELQQFNLPVKLDSNGCNPDVIAALIQEKLVQQVAIDIKGPWMKYPLLTGNRCQPDQAEHNFESIIELTSQYPKTIYFRCTKVPNLQEQDLNWVRSIVPEKHTLIFQEYIEPQQPYNRSEHAQADSQERRQAGNVVC